MTANDVPCTEGVLASRPSAASLSDGLYLATDTGELFFSDGSVWLPVIFGSEEAVPGGAAVLLGGVLAYYDSGGAPHNVQF